MLNLFNLAHDIIDLVYPRICGACDGGVPVKGGIFCIECLAGLPLTNYHQIEGNPFERHFWGRVPIRAGAAMYFFVPGGKTQTLLHNIKYRRRRELAVEVGRMYGQDLSQSVRFAGITHVVPVPLHWRKQRMRGFNQSLAFAEGIAAAMEIPCPSILKRARHTPSQTRMTRSQRIENMAGAFSLHGPERLKGAHVLLVDDVLTTGATLEACALVLQGADLSAISVATIACGRI